MAEEQKFSPGEEREIFLRSQGTDENLIGQWKNQAYQKVTEDYGEEVARQYFGIKDAPVGPMQDFVSNNLAAKPPAPLPDQPTDEHYAQSALEAFEAGQQMGNVGMLMRNSMPNVNVAKGAPIYYDLMQAAGQFTGDAPAMALGASGGAIAGAEIGAIAGPIGSAVGAVAGAAYGAWGMPEFARQYMVDQYRNGSFKGPMDYFKRIIPILNDTNKAGALGVATAGVGGATAAKLGQTALKPFAQSAGKLAAEIGTMTTAGAALDERLPSWDDLVHNALFVGALHGVSSTFRNASELYARTGVDPVESAVQAKTDPIMRQQLIAPEEQMTFELMSLMPEQQGEFEMGGRIDYGPPVGEQMAMEFLPKMPTEQTAFGVDSKTATSVSSLGFDKKSEAPSTVREYTTKIREKLSSEKNDLIKEKEAITGGGEDMSANEYLKLAQGILESPNTTKKGFYEAADLERSIQEKFTPEKIARLEAIDKRVKHLELKEKYLDSWVEKNVGKVKKDKYTVMNQKSLFDPRYVEENSRARAINESPQLEFGFDIPSEDPLEKVAFKEQSEMDLPTDEYGNVMLGQLPLDLLDALVNKPDFASSVKAPETNQAEDLSESFRKEIITEKKTKMKTPVTGRSIMNDVFDQFSYINEAVKSIYKDKAISEASKNSYLLAKWFKGYSDLARYIHENGPVDYNTGESLGIPGVAEILRPFEKLSGKWYDKVRTNRVRAFETYRVSERMLEKEAQGIRTTNNPGALEKARKVVENGKKEFGEAARLMTKNQNAGLKYLADAGILSKESYNKILSANESYVFFERVFESKETVNALGTENPIKGMKGVAPGAEPSKILAPTISETRRMRAIIRLAERQRVLNSLIDLAKEDKEGKYIRNVTKGAEPVLSEAEVFNLISESEKIIEQEDNPTKESVQQKPKMFDDMGRLLIFKDQKPVYLAVDENLKKSIEELDNNYQIVQPLMRAAVKVGNIARSGIINNPAYPLINGFKDMFTSAVFSKHGYLAPVEGWSAFYDAFTRNEKFMQYVRDKGPSGSMFPHLENFYDSEGNYIYDHGWTDRTWNMVKTPFDIIKRVNMAVEHAPRYGEYKLARQQGKSGMEAALAARDITVNFQNTGSSDFMKAWRQLTPFMGAQLSAMEKFGREFDFKNNPELAAKNTAKAITTIAIPTLAMLLYRKSRPDLDALYEHSSEYDKNTKWGIPISNWRTATITDTEVPDYLKRTNPETGQMEVNDGGVMWLPKPQELGFLFGTVTERLFDAFLNDHPTEHSNIAGLLWDTFSPNTLPPALENSIELGMMMGSDSARDIKTGNPIVKDSLLKELPAERYTAATSKTAIALSQGLSMIPGAARWSFIAPDNIDQIINKWTGGMGTLVTQTLDVGLKTPAVEGYERPDGSVFFNNAMVKRFYKKFPYPNPSALREVYDEAKFLDQEYTSYRNKLKTGDETGANAIEAQYGPLVGRLNGYTQAFGKIQSQIKMVTNDRDMKGYEKTQIINSYLYEMTSIADDAVNYMKENKAEVELLKKDLEKENRK